MNKEIVIVTKDGFKFEFKGEKANEIIDKTYSDGDGLIIFGSALVIPSENLSYYWVKDVR